ncbi:hypothetical protein SAMN02745216_04260 [Desulfatibacillum alkenivorans DSM 16219]|jgi:hypothetical protein|uniref:Uncharacterized protein n=1 Tax=Desulfatibacillum alkenivorans DSM 16219 TaxID=1121393 RepID=A0A1M6W6W9_9BACT|nr:hypothetical protein [Desulfatibacillum alkenivorans]SHK89246.1 hypothetical protein SAMN02745216_04260 [Desulfatibacillum alkenivorans DSM 16219]
MNRAKKKELKKRGYAKLFSNPKVNYMADLRLALNCYPDADVDATYKYIYESLLKVCHESAMNFGRHRAIISKYDTTGFRIDMLHQFFASTDSNFAKAVNMVKMMKMQMVVQIMQGDFDRQLTEDELEKQFRISNILNSMPDSPEKRFFTHFIRDILRGKYYVCLNEIPWLMARTLSVGFRSYYRDQLKNLINRKRKEGRCAYDVRVGTFRMRKKKPERTNGPVVARIGRGVLKVWAKNRSAAFLARPIERFLQKMKEKFGPTRLVRFDLQPLNFSYG